MSKFIRNLAGAVMAAGLLVPVAAQAQTSLRVPMVSRTIFYLPAWTAEQQGFFKGVGVGLVEGPMEVGLFNPLA